MKTTPALRGIMAIASLAAVACNGILGIDEKSYEESAGSGGFSGGPDGGAGGPGSGGTAGVGGGAVGGNAGAASGGKGGVAGSGEGGPGDAGQGGGAGSGEGGLAGAGQGGDAGSGEGGVAGGGESGGGGTAGFGGSTGGSAGAGDHDAGAQGGDPGWDASAGGSAGSQQADASLDAPQDTSVDAPTPADADPCSLCTAPPDGIATCVDQKCGFEIEASSVPGFWQLDIGQNNFFALTDDGRAVISPILGAVDVLVDLDTHQTKSVASVGGRRTSLIIKPPIRYKVGGYGNSFVAEIEGTKLYTWGYGCCNVDGHWMAVDAENLVGYQQYARWDFNTGNVTTLANVPHLGYASLADSKTLYEVSPGGHVTRINTMTQTITWEKLVETWNNAGVGVVGSDMTVTAMLFAQAASLTGVLARLDSSGNTQWKKNDWNIPSYPVLLSSNDIIIGTRALNSDPASIKRISQTDGSVVWSRESPGEVRDLIVADGNLLYVLVQVPPDASLWVLGLDQTTGNILYTYKGLGVSSGNDAYGAPEMLLRNGVLYVFSGRFTALPVTAAHYDYSSPWPVKLHDNQRTSYRLAPLNL